MVSPVVGGWSFSSEIHEFGSSEDEFLERGDIEGATELNLRFWLAGPKRSLDQLNVIVVEKAREMQKNAFRVQLASKEAVAQGIEPPATKRLAEIECPALIITGDQDVADIFAIAERLHRDISGSVLQPLKGVGHLLCMEQPEKFTALLKEFLRRVRER